MRKVIYDTPRFLGSYEVKIKDIGKIDLDFIYKKLLKRKKPKQMDYFFLVNEGYFKGISGFLTMVHYVDNSFYCSKKISYIV